MIMIMTLITHSRLHITADPRITDFLGFAFSDYECRTRIQLDVYLHVSDINIIIIKISYLRLIHVHSQVGSRTLYCISRSLIYGYYIYLALYRVVNTTVTRSDFYLYAYIYNCILIQLLQW